MKEKIIKNHIGAFAIAAVILFIAALAVVIYMWDEDIGTDPINSINDSRSQIIMTGSGYSLNDRQREEYKKEQEKHIEKIKEKMEDPESIQSRIKAAFTHAEKSDSTESGGNKSEDNRKEENSQSEINNSDTDTTEDPDMYPETPETSDPGGETGSTVLPVITTDLQEGQKVSGNALTFTVKAVSYKNEILDSFDVKVYLNGERLYSSGTNGNGIISYRADGLLVNGANEIIITAADSSGNSSKIKRQIDVNINGSRPVEGKVTFRVEAPSIGLGTLYSATEEIYKGESTASFVDRVLKDAGFGIDNGGSIAYGYYLRRLYKPGITDGWRVDPAVERHLEEINAALSQRPQADSLGEHDIYDASGWMYCWNGEWPDGMSAITLSDGDELRIVFTLYYGYEYDGTWSDTDL